MTPLIDSYQQFFHKLIEIPLLILFSRLSSHGAMREVQFKLIVIHFSNPHLDFVSDFFSRYRYVVIAELL